METFFLLFALKKHPTFWTDGQTVLTKLHVSPWEAALGAKVETPTLGGPVSVNIPPGAQGGQQLRLKGRGLPISESEHGDMLVQLVIAVPTSLTAREKELFEELQKESAFLTASVTHNRA